jgi:hypothetical protein
LRASETKAGLTADVDSRPQSRVRFAFTDDLAHDRRRVPSAEEEVSEEVTERVAF